MVEKTHENSGFNPISTAKKGVYIHGGIPGLTSGSSDFYRDFVLNFCLENQMSDKKST